METSLLELKRNLLRQGMDPHQDLEGHRQVVFLQTGVDLARIPGSKHFVQRQLEQYPRILYKQSLAYQLAPHRQVLALWVQDLAQRGIHDPVPYVERHPQIVTRIYQLPYAQAQQLAHQYQHNLEKYGQIASFKISVWNAVEKAIESLKEARGEGRGVGLNPTSLPSLPKQEERKVGAIPENQHSTLFHKKLFQQSNSKQASGAEKNVVAHGDANANAILDSPTKTHPKSSIKTTTTTTSSFSSKAAIAARARSSTTTTPSAPAATAIAQPPSLSPLRKRITTSPALLFSFFFRVMLIGGGGALAAMFLSYLLSFFSNQEQPESEEDQDFQHLYTLLTGDYGSYKNRAKSLSSSAIHTNSIKDKKQDNNNNNENNAMMMEQDSENRKKWMPHRRYMPLFQASPDTPLTSSSSVSSSPVQQQQQPYQQHQQQLSSAASVAQQQQGQPEDAVLHWQQKLPQTLSSSSFIPPPLPQPLPTTIRSTTAAAATTAATTVAATASTTTTTTKQRDLYDLIASIENGSRSSSSSSSRGDPRRISEFVRQLAKVLALGAPHRFPHVRSLSGGYNMVLELYWANNKNNINHNNNAQDLPQLARFLKQARVAAGLNEGDDDDDEKETLELFDQVARCLLTDMVEMEASLLLGTKSPTTMEAINDVVDFMAHVSLVYDALTMGFSPSFQSTTSTTTTSTTKSSAAEADPSHAPAWMSIPVLSSDHKNKIVGHTSQRQQDRDQQQQQQPESSTTTQESTTAVIVY